MQAPLDLTRPSEVNKQQQPPSSVEQPTKPGPVEHPKAAPAVATQPAAVAPPPPQAKPTGYAAIAATNAAPASAPGIPINSAPEPPTDSFTSIGEWNQVKHNTKFTLS